MSARVQYLAVCCTYYMPKETYYMPKETYYPPKETYWE